jgi:sensor histidine kinase regulating citrate/malate metabolism
MYVTLWSQLTYVKARASQQPFFTTKRTGEGTGLDLSISWDIVIQQHRGTIAVDSRVGEFTEFTVRLPRVRGRRDAYGDRDMADILMHDA